MGRAGGEEGGRKVGWGRAGEGEGVDAGRRRGRREGREGLLKGIFPK